MNNLIYPVQKRNVTPIFCLIFMLFACDKETPAPKIVIEDICTTLEHTICLDAPTQRIGEATAGYDYLVNGDYIKSGIPYNVFISVYGTDNANELNRSGDNASISHEFTAVDAANGVRIVAPNCLQCHAQRLNGELILGLGNAMYDFTIDQSETARLANFGIQAIYGNPSPEYTASEQFLKATAATAPHLVTAVRGVNPADKLALVLAAHRDPLSLSWKDTPSNTIPAEVIPSDVPAWWLLKKKNAMFYTAVGRNDFARFMMASSLLTVHNINEAAEIDTAFEDVLAYILSLEAPAYPNVIQAELAEAGEDVFRANCARCHGTYGIEESYPNALIPTDYVGTDPLLAESNYNYPEFISWFNTSWFGTNDPTASLKSENAYIAPPLDGIWATAPYLHNGSIPTLADLLDSSQRPVYWKRSFNSKDYDFDKVGWNYSVETMAADTDTYNTRLKGYGNQGHYFGDNLTETDREALLEYLKTL